MTTTALNKEQMQRFERATKDMLELVEDDATYLGLLCLVRDLPDGLLTDLASLGLMYLGTERARRHVAKTN